MADTSLFSRLQRLFSSDVIIRNIGGKRVKIMDTNRIQKYGINIFSFLSGVPLIGSSLSKIRVYYSPDEFSTSARLEEYDKINIQRATPDNPTTTYTLNMKREYDIKYKIKNSIITRYKRVISSNYDTYKNNKFDFIKDFEPGLIKEVSETFTNSYSPDYFKWLSPKFTYNPTYKWSLVNAGDEVSTANLNSKSPNSVGNGTLEISSTILSCSLLYFIRSDMLINDKLYFFAIFSN